MTFNNPPPLKQTYARLQGKIVLVTGASSGIGEAAAHTHDDVDQTRAATDEAFAAVKRRLGDLRPHPFLAAHGAAEP